MSSINLGGKQIQFKLDTGAEVTAISDSTYQTLQGVRLSPSTKPLYGPASQVLKVLGQFNGKLAHKEHSHQEKIYVVKGLRNNAPGYLDLEQSKISNSLKEWKQCLLNPWT